MFTYVNSCLSMIAMFTSACLPMFTHVYSCLPLFISVYLCLLLFIRVNLSLPQFTRACNIGIYPICRDATDFSRWRPTLKYSNTYLCSLTSYGLITGLADFFTERCYWYLQRSLNACCRVTPKWVENPNLADFLLLFLSFIFLL